MLGEEGLALIEHNADTILQEIGIDFRDDPEALQIWQDAGADVKGERVHFPRGMCRTLVQTLGAAGIHAACAQPGAQRGDRRRRTVFAPAYGSPFVRNLDEGRRYAQIEDFRNFVKLAYCRPRCTIRAARSASRSICRSTSGISTWSTAT